MVYNRGVKIELMVVYLVVVIGSMVCHEIAHGYTSYFLGDDTAKLHNRLSLNPLHHLDLFMSIILPLMLILVGAPVFGGARPVLVNRRKLKYGDVGMAIVAVSGPIVNLLLAIIAGVCLGIVNPVTDSLLAQFLIMVVLVNLGFFLFNMIPIPPLDGSRVLYVLAPDFIQRLYDKIESFGIWPLIIIISVGYVPVSQYVNWGVGVFWRLWSMVFY